MYPSSHWPCSFPETINGIPFSRFIINRFWWTRFQMMDNAVLHHIMEKNLWLFMKIQKFWAKRRFRSGFRPWKNTEFIWNEQILESCETWLPFYNDFQILYTGSNNIIELLKYLILKNNLNFLTNGGFFPPPSKFFQNLN